MTVADDLRRVLLDDRNNSRHHPFKCRGTIGEWIRCNRGIPYNKDIQSTVEHHLRLRKRGYPALIYRSNVSSFKISTEKPSFDRFKHFTRYTTSYSSNLTFATVKGAGHTTPEYKPKECLEIFLDESLTQQIHSCVELVGVKKPGEKLNLSRKSSVPDGPGVYIDKIGVAQSHVGRSGSVPELRAINEVVPVICGGESYICKSELDVTELALYGMGQTTLER
ncbi:hypothetical protein PR202_ga24529 [Eleusine coracana subsp. coracana]|uniref:Uncharacterized protein n=1 Tax=Eleusine coracana subsp. coracana TaxID=191504 RepID=A0AAV5D933_ELECO|nr:hypothetical protein PR202_ga24529 [Eleusine coracana subsp. coracana]